MGEPNGSIPTIQPVFSKPMWGTHAASVAQNSFAFVSAVSITSGAIKSYGLKKRVAAVRGCKNVKKSDMKWNEKTPKMSVDPETYRVEADGEVMTCAPATQLPLTKLYNLF